MTMNNNGFVFVHFSAQDVYVHSDKLQQTSLYWVYVYVCMCVCACLSYHTPETKERKLISLGGVAEQKQLER